MKKIEFHKEIFLIEDFLSDKECEELIRLADAIGFEEAKVQADDNLQTLMKEVRNNERILYNSNLFAEQFWNRAKPFIVGSIGKYVAYRLNELFRFYKYSSGQHFKMHQDNSYEPNENECSFYTFLLYLNDDFDGGETEFENVCVVNPKKGSLLIFYHPLRHEGKSLISGKKYVLRSDVIYKLMEEK